MICLLGRFCVLLAETLHPTGCIDQFVLAGEIGVTVGTDFDREVLLDGRRRFNHMAAGTSDIDVFTFWVNAFFHKGALLPN